MSDIIYDIFHLKADNNGFYYYNELPSGTRLATFNDFLLNNQRKLGMCFLVWELSNSRYGLYYVKRTLTQKRLKPFIDNKNVYVFTPDKYIPEL